MKFQVNKRVKGWVFSIERKLSDNDWVAMQILRVPKTNISETRARRLLDDLIIGYKQQGLTVRGSVGAERYIISSTEELSTQRSEPMPSLFRTSEPAGGTSTSEEDNGHTDRGTPGQSESGDREVEVAVS